MKKVLATILSLVMVFSLVPMVALNASALSSGKCGKNVKYSFDKSSGKLTISGKGDMFNYDNYDSPFHYNLKIKSVVIKKGVTSIGDYAFSDCEALKSVKISNGVKIIGDDVFCRCGLTNITIPKSVKMINNEAFLSCFWLKSIKVSKKNKKYSSANGVLLNKSKTKLLRCPAGKTSKKYKIPKKVKTIGEIAFMYTSLRSIKIGNKVKTIGDCAFKESELKKVTMLKSVKTIGFAAFHKCYSLKSVKIGKKVKTIDGSAFYGCSFKSVTIPKSVTEIGESAFGYGSDISGFTIKGYKGTVAEKYAKENGFKFKNI